MLYKMGVRIDIRIKVWLVDCTIIKENQYRIGISVGISGSYVVYSSLNGFLEYFAFKYSIKVFNATAVELPIINTISFLP